jgi:cephalosporin hydroxylase
MNFAEEKLEYIKEHKKNNFSYCDNYLTTKLPLNVIDYIYESISKKRYMNFQEREQYLLKIKPEKDNNIVFDQGLNETVTWKEKVMLKSPNDLIILNMLIWELKPKSIIELGTGNGSSSEYMESILKSYNQECEILTFDIINKEEKINSVKKYHANFNDLNTLITYSNMFKALNRPLLIIEDGHSNYFELIKLMASYCSKDDYIFIEDSGDTKDYWGCSKQDIVKYLSSINFLIDTKYTDFFGFNRTSCVNSILKKF